MTKQIAKIWTQLCKYLQKFEKDNVDNNFHDSMVKAKSN